MVALLRIASVPSGHAYVRHLDDPSGPAGVVRLPDPAVPGAPAGRWWPSPVLEPAWLHAHRSEYDLVHLHFGFEHRTAEQLVEMVRTLADLRCPLVLTLHDLANPHLDDQASHAAALDVLVPAAAAVVTLTPGAAAEIASRWGRSATVLPHPHVVDLERIAAPRGRGGGLLVGLHAKPRANNDPDAVRPELERAVAALPGARLVPDPRPGRLPDDELWQRLSSLDVLVLAYRFGTHSGFVEACHDLGTTVVAARTGYLHEQQAVVTYDLGCPGSLTRALATAARSPAPRADATARAEQRRDLAAAHADLYASAVSRLRSAA